MSGMSAPRRYRLDENTHDNLMSPVSAGLAPVSGEGPGLPEPVFPQHPKLLKDPGPDTQPDRRPWGSRLIYRKMRGWLFPYLRSRLLPGDFHPITAYLFLEYKCNIDCWYCWSFNNKVMGMTEEVARRSLDWLYDRGCRVVGLMGGEPLLRPKFVHKVTNYAAKKGFWVYIGTNGRLLRPDLADRLGDSGVAVFNLALDAWDIKPGLPKALLPVRKNLEHMMRKQHVYGYMIFFNINICRNNLDDVRMITEYARAHRLATDYHLNETPMLEQDAHFKHLDENPTYIRPEDWRAVDQLIDWLIEKNKAGYRIVNSIPRLQEMKAFARMSSGFDLRRTGWHGDGVGLDSETEGLIASMPGVSPDGNGNYSFADWNCRGGQNNIVIRTDGSLAPCFPMYPAGYNWGTIEAEKLDASQLALMKKTCQKHCFSTLNHNLAYCYNDARVIRWLWKQALNRFQGATGGFED
jgi:MoaA/NifB/PqqE/SkfB family radical SAM enzyme